MYSLRIKIVTANHITVCIKIDQEIGLLLVYIQHEQHLYIISFDELLGFSIHLSVLTYKIMYSNTFWMSLSMFCSYFSDLPST